MGEPLDTYYLMIIRRLEEASVAHNAQAARLEQALDGIAWLRKQLNTITSVDGSNNNELTKKKKGGR